MTAFPGPYGAHNWHPMSFNPQTGLVYIAGAGRSDEPDAGKDLRRTMPRRPATSSAPGWNLGFMLNADPPKSPAFGRLLAWDPVKQKEAWRAEYVAPWNGGTLTTAGNLVFQGTADGRFVAYNATTGEKLWESPTGTGVVAAASTYMHRRQAICLDRGRLGRRVRDHAIAPPNCRAPARSTPSRSTARRRCRPS